MRRLAAVLLTTLALPLCAAPAHAASPRCGPGADEVRFDDGRLLVTRREREVAPGILRERWWSCWRPTGRRALIADRRHRGDAGELMLVGVRRGRFAALGGDGRLDVLDGRTGRLSATMPLTGAVRELVVSASGRAAALQEVGDGQRRLVAADGTTSCLEDAGLAATPAGDVFGDLVVRGEHLAWHREGETFGASLVALRC